MYTVLIVDDEAPARELLKIKIDWASIGCEIIHMAKNGQEALDFYNLHSPDLIITDIQMPVMDGLELIESIKKVNSLQPIIILSCHESFSFARKAIKLGVNDYLVKDSFETEELYSIITDMFKNKSIQISTENNHPKSIVDKNKSTIIKTLMFDDLSADIRKDYIKRYALNLISKQYILLYLDIEILNQDIVKPDSHYMKSQDIQKLENILRIELSNYALGEVCHDSQNVFLVIYNIKNTYSEIQKRREAIFISTHLRHKINSQFDVQTTIGISSSFSDLSELGTAYVQGKQAVERKIISGYDKSYLHTSSSTFDENQYIKILNVKLNRIEDYLNTYKYEPVIKEIKDIFLQNLNGFMQYNFLKHTNWSLLSMLIEFCSKSNLSYVEICSSRSPWERIMDIKTVAEMCTWFIKAIEKIREQLVSDSNNNYSYHVHKCIKYINKNYKENISLKDLADRYDINNAYLSRIFKKEIGHSMTDYINQVRIEEAKKLIQNTNKKMYVIADLTGFSSTQRFFLIFKKVVGLSPGEFRKN